jgi:hypothetical protein
MGQLPDVRRAVKAHAVRVGIAPASVTDQRRSSARAVSAGRPIEKRSDLMSHPFPLVVEASYRRSEALRHAQQERLASVASSQSRAGHARFGRDAALVTGVVARATSLHAIWSKIALSRATV